MLADKAEFLLRCHYSSDVLRLFDCDLPQCRLVETSAAGFISALLCIFLGTVPPSKEPAACVHLDIVKLNLGCNYWVIGACKPPSLA